MKTYLSILLLSLLISPLIIYAQDTIPVYDYEDTIVVTASRIPVKWQDLSRSVVTFDESFIKTAPVHSIQEALEFAAGVDIQQQGSYGVMGHARIRGANYEQTLLLINGAKINDPQSGHHNFHLPLDLSNIEKIEILKGPASRLFGPNAFAGAVNIITKQEKGNTLTFQGSFGSDQTVDGLSSLNLSFDNIYQSLSIGTHVSDGYRKNTAYQILTGSYRVTIDLNPVVIDLFGGYTRKAFGANQFYGSSSELQWEKTNTAFLNSGFKIRGQDSSFDLRLYWRQNKDDYIWNKEHPEWYENFHKSNVYTAEAQLNLTLPFGEFALAGELSEDELISTNLGRHDRQRMGIYVEQHLKLTDQLSMIPGASLIYYSDWGWHIWPGIDAEYRINGNHQLYISYGRAFRVPTFTELYYTDPDNLGNPDLKAENAWTIETGYRYENFSYSAQIAYFFRRSTDLIDWVKMYPDSHWIATNFSSVTTNGFELISSWENPLEMKRFAIKRISFSYAYLNAIRDNDRMLLKYVSNHLRHQCIIGLNLNYGLFGLIQNFNVRFEDRISFGNHFLLDTRLSWQRNHIRLFADGTNLLNTPYREYLFIPMPGRKFSIGMSYSFF